MMGRSYFLCFFVQVSNEDWGATRNGCWRWRERLDDLFLVLLLKGDSLEHLTGVNDMSTVNERVEALVGQTKVDKVEQERAKRSEGKGAMRWEKRKRRNKQEEK
jgi:hypothetical protein